MYPVGSNGASQAIVDARKLGRAFLDHGITPAALHAYEDEMRPATSAMVLAGRGSGPDSVLQIVEDRSGGTFADIEDVMPHEERAELAASYKRTAGFSIDELNASPPIIP
jgi:2-polyprenyl-6-methoxyphenol hydroxylase-like FAD-dependent oxidoreductase